MSSQTHSSFSHLPCPLHSGLPHGLGLGVVVVVVVVASSGAASGAGAGASGSGSGVVVGAGVVVAASFSFLMSLRLGESVRSGAPPALGPAPGPASPGPINPPPRPPPSPPAAAAAAACSSSVHGLPSHKHLPNIRSQTPPGGHTPHSVGGFSHLAPVHPPSHSQFPFKHCPWLLHSGSGQAMAIPQSAPIHPGSQIQVPGMEQSPCPLQHIGTEQSTPPKPAKQRQDPSTHSPRPVHSLGQKFWHATPVYPA
mmetsp:Transcript_11336/g.25172  ORF Transcript_11336/g.25172 Transcript_11336/m.25172 type:complete len:253 (-) Transcript_11336:992-1750(-)